MEKMRKKVRPKRRQGKDSIWGVVREVSKEKATEIFIIELEEGIWEKPQDKGAVDALAGG